MSTHNVYVSQCWVGKKSIGWHACCEVCGVLPHANGRDKSVADNVAYNHAADLIEVGADDALADRIENSVENS